MKATYRTETQKSCTTAIPYYPRLFLILYEISISCD